MFMTRPKCHYHDYGPGTAGQEPSSGVYTFQGGQRQEWSWGWGEALLPGYKLSFNFCQTQRLAFEFLQGLRVSGYFYLHILAFTSELGVTTSPALTLNIGFQGLPQGFFVCFFLFLEN